MAFRRLNAFDLSAVPPGSYDVVFITQSLHHFTPGQLAMMIAPAPPGRGASWASTGGAA